MIRTDWRLTASHLTLAAFVAAGLSAAPFGFGDGLTPQTNAATAQGSDSGGSGSGSGGSGGSNGSGAGGSDDGTAGSEDGTTGDDGTAGATGGTDGTGTSDAQSVPAGQNPGVAEERATAAATGISPDTEDSVYEILGTTREQAEAADTHTSATAQYGPLAAYQAEVERGNLDAAAENLAAIAEEPVTEEMVTEVNTELGVDTTLTAKQIADAAARKQDEGS